MRIHGSPKHPLVTYCVDPILAQLRWNSLPPHPARTISKFHYRKQPANSAHAVHVIWMSHVTLTHFLYKNGSCRPQSVNHFNKDMTQFAWWSTQWKQHSHGNGYVRADCSWLCDTRQQVVRCGHILAPVSCRRIQVDHLPRYVVCARGHKSASAAVCAKAWENA